MSRSLQTVILASCSVLWMFGLAACSPQFDWRTIKNEAFAYSALFPSKPQVVERTLTYQQNSLQQSLEFAKVDDDVFAVMTTQIPAAVATQVKEIEQMLQNTLLQQSASLHQTTPLRFHLIKDAYFRTGPLGQSKQRTQDYYLDISHSKKLMRVRWLIRPGSNGSIYLYQISVIRSSSESASLEKRLDQENINIFFDEFRPN